MTTRTAAGARSDASLAAILIAALLGIGLIYVAGFVSAEVIHDAAHDTRHAIGFPCH